MVYTHIPIFYCADNVSIELNEGNQVFKLYVSELGGITDMPSYHCSDNVRTEWKKDNQFVNVSDCQWT